MHRKKIVTAVILLGAVIAVACFSSYNTAQYSCLECRATLEKCCFFGIPFHSVTHNAYSQAILSHAPAHQHQWRWCGTKLSYSLVSVTRGCGKRHPIWRLPVSVQADYARLVSPTDLHKTLQRIDSTDCTVAEAEVQHVYATVLNSR